MYENTSIKKPKDVNHKTQKEREILLFKHLFCGLQTLRGGKISIKHQETPYLV